MKFSIFLTLIGLLFPNFQIDSKHSNVTYKGSHPFHDWTGKTSQIAIESDCTKNSSSCDALFSIPLMSFLSGNDNRDSNMLFYVEAFSYPHVKILFSNLNINTFLGNKDTRNITSEIDFHGYKHSQTIPIKISIEEETVNIYSYFTIHLDLFDVERPSLLMLPIKNEIHIDVSIQGHFKE